jgi:TetR/AcrR family transcriptional repressor of mexJK operon
MPATSDKAFATVPATSNQDPRVLRTRAAALDAARALFLRNGYARTTMDDIAAEADLTKRTLYNNYADKEVLFRQIVADVFGIAETFAKNLHVEFREQLATGDVRAALEEIAKRMVIGILRPDVIALRRLLIGEGREFPELAKEYFDRAPGAVMDALASEFAALHRAGRLSAPDPRRAAEQFAYLVVGEPLDRALLAGTIPGKQRAVACALEGVETFLARYGKPRRGRTTR